MKIRTRYGMLACQPASRGIGPSVPGVVDLCDGTYLVTLPTDEKWLGIRANSVNLRGTAEFGELLSWGKDLDTGRPMKVIVTPNFRWTRIGPEDIGSETFNQIPPGKCMKVKKVGNQFFDILLKGDNGQGNWRGDWLFTMIKSSDGTLIKNKLGEMPFPPAKEDLPWHGALDPEKHPVDYAEIMEVGGMTWVCAMRDTSAVPSAKPYSIPVENLPIMGMVDAKQNFWLGIPKDFRIKSPAWLPSTA